MDTYKQLCLILLGYTMPHKQQKAPATITLASMNLRIHLLPLAWASIQ